MKYIVLDNRGYMYKYDNKAEAEAYANSHKYRLKEYDQDKIQRAIAKCDDTLWDKINEAEDNRYGYGAASDEAKAYRRLSRCLAKIGLTVDEWDLWLCIA